MRAIKKASQGKYGAARALKQLSTSSQSPCGRSIKQVQFSRPVEGESREPVPEEQVLGPELGLWSLSGREPAVPPQQL